MEYYGEVLNKPQIREVNEELASIKADLGKLIYDEFNRYDNQLQVGAQGGGSGASVLADVCFVVDALGEVTK